MALWSLTILPLAATLTTAPASRYWTVSMLRGAERHQLRVPENEPLLTAVERAGLLPSSECRRGRCLSCAARASSRAHHSRYGSMVALRYVMRPMPRALCFYARRLRSGRGWSWSSAARATHGIRSTASVGRKTSMFPSRRSARGLYSIECRTMRQPCSSGAWRCPMRRRRSENVRPYNARERESDACDWSVVQVAFLFYRTSNNGKSSVCPAVLPRPALAVFFTHSSRYARSRHQNE